MKPELISYDVSPVIVPADRESEVVIRPRFDHAHFEAGKDYGIQHTLMEDSCRHANVPQQGVYTVKPRADGSLRFRSFFEGEQEHCVRLIHPAPEGRTPAVTTLRLYSVRPDLYARRPFKGDVHMHSCRSDGRECPAYLVAACRRIGLDFTAVTDHHKYEPSLEAMAAFRGVKMDLRLFPGEEVHLPRHPVHMINYGGRFSVNAASKDPVFEKEVAAIQKRMVKRLPPGVDPYVAAGCLWGFAKIREAGGLAIYCHPHWIWGASYNVAAAVNEWLFAEKPFDAFELIGGYWLHEVESNLLQLAWYHEQRAQGRTVPIVGASDSHGCEREGLFGWYYTIVFAPACEFDALRTSICQGWSVAVEALPGQTSRAHGPYRLAKFAQFLLREVFPRHDELCAAEGQLMLDHVAGDPAAARALARLTGRCAALQARQWA